MPVHVIAVDWADARAERLRRMLDDEMMIRYTGRHDDDPDFPAKAARAFAVDPDTVEATLLAVDEAGTGIGHAALRRLGQGHEVKRVVVAPDGRGRGVGKLLMAAVEEAARARGAASVVLQTGDRQPDAVAMYESIGYRRIPTFEPYLEITNSICFEKRLD